MMIALVAVLTITGVFHGTAGGVLLALGMGAFGAIIWRSDGIAWLDIASWTVPLSIWVSLRGSPFPMFHSSSRAWSRRHGSQPLSSGCRPFVGGTAGSRKGFPWGSGGRSVAQLYGLDLAIGRALNQDHRDADTSRLRRRCEEPRSEAQALTTDEPGASQARTLLLVYLEALHPSREPVESAQPAFDALDRQIQGFRDALKIASSIPPQTRKRAGDIGGE